MPEGVSISAYLVRGSYGQLARKNPRYRSPAEMSSVYNRLKQVQLLWDGHDIRMSDRLPKKVC